MNAEQLEVLMRWYEQNDDTSRQKEGLGALQVLAPSLARRVLAAEKLVGAVDSIIAGCDCSWAKGRVEDEIDAYREASK